jgi:hypothetical protein
VRISNQGSDHLGTAAGTNDSNPFRQLRAGRLTWIRLRRDLLESLYGEERIACVSTSAQLRDILAVLATNLI